MVDSLVFCGDVTVPAGWEGPDSGMIVGSGHSYVSFTPCLHNVFPFSVKHAGNLSIDQIINVARQMRPRSMARKLEGTVKEILGTCQSVGCTVDGQHPHDLIDKIRSGDVKIPADW